MISYRPLLIFCVRSSFEICTTKFFLGEEGKCTQNGQALPMIYLHVITYRSRRMMLMYRVDNILKVIGFSLDHDLRIICSMKVLRCCVCSYFCF